MLLEIKNLNFSYSEEKPLFQNLNLAVAEGEILALAGESGCGKSTLLGLIYGLFDWQSGEIFFNGRALLGPKGNLVPGESDMKFVAQNYDLMPYATVYDNVGKFLSNINLSEKKRKIMELLEVVGMEDYADTKPRWLSGGQQQRVAIARALSVWPQLLLLDEPFSNIDFSRKVLLREKLFDYARAHGIGLVISTHEIQEVMPWLKKILVLKAGEIVQYDTPWHTYNFPKDEYVARLFGEVNGLSDIQKMSLGLDKNIWYPHQIKLEAEGTHKAEVLESRFAGCYFWNKIQIAGIELIAYSETSAQGTVGVTFCNKPID